MARPLKKRRGKLPSAVIALRRHLSETQQQFAARLGLAITSVARYETQRPPSGDVLGKLAQLAAQVGRGDLAEVFQQALESELGAWATGEIKLDITPRNDEERLWMCALLGVLRNPEYALNQASILPYLQAPAERCIENLNVALKQRQLTVEAKRLLAERIDPAEIAARLGVPESDVRYFAAIQRIRAMPHVVSPLEGHESDPAVVDAVNADLAKIKPADLPEWARPRKGEMK